MRKLLFTSILSLLTVFTFADNPISIRVNAESSTVNWTGSKVTYQHTGTVDIQKGVLIFEGENLVGGEIAIDMNTISNTSIEKETKRNYLESHLKNEDFFHVDKYSYSYIKINSAEKNSDGTYVVNADLTIKGITNQIKFVAEVKLKGDVFLATASIKIDRTKWDVRYGSGSFFEDLGDKMILDAIGFDIVF